MKLRVSQGNDEMVCQCQQQIDVPFCKMPRIDPFSQEQNALGFFIQAKRNHRFNRFGERACVFFKKGTLDVLKTIGVKILGAGRMSTQPVRHRQTLCR